MSGWTSFRDAVNPVNIISGDSSLSPGHLFHTVTDQAARFGEQLASSDPFKNYGPSWSRRYRQHIADALTSPGSVIGGYFSDYAVARRAGASEGTAYRTTLRNLGDSAAIAAIAYGGYTLAGAAGGDAAGEGVSYGAGDVAAVDSPYVSGSAYSGWAGAVPDDYAYSAGLGSGYVSTAPALSLSTAAGSGLTFGKGVTLGQEILGGLSLLRTLLGGAPAAPGGTQAAPGSFLDQPPTSGGGGGGAGLDAGTGPVLDQGSNTLLYAGAAVALLGLALYLKKRK